MNSFDQIFEERQILVKSIFEMVKAEHLTYHNWWHTEKVVQAAKEIAESIPSINDIEQKALLLAAVFHDAGFPEGREGHEARSAQIAREFLTSREVSNEDIQLIEKCIMVTQMGVEPTDDLEKVMKDADLSHLGQHNYVDGAYTNLYKEIRTYFTPQLTEGQWCTMCVQFMQNHVFYTTFAKENYGPQKKTNIDILIQMEEENSISAREAEKQIKKKKKKKPKPDIPEKGIETMFRVALRNHLSLSRIADNKANTLISVNAIIISIVLSAMYPKMDTNPYLILPGLSLIIFSVATIIVSILSTIPKTTHGMLTRKEVEEKKGNLIFFGNFHKMSLEDYEWGVSELMNDKDYLYKSLTRDLYFLGKVLNRKYTLLRYSYAFFVVGLCLSIVLFLLSLKGMGEY